MLLQLTLAYDGAVMDNFSNGLSKWFMYELVRLVRCHTLCRRHMTKYNMLVYYVFCLIVDHSSTQYGNKCYSVYVLGISQYAILILGTIRCQLSVGVFTENLAIGQFY